MPRPSTDAGRLLVFAKAPIAGYAKTRLIPVLGAEGAAELQAELVLRTLWTARQCVCEGLELWCSPEARDPFFTGCAAEFPLSLHPQSGRDLGERMGGALRSALERSPCAVLIGVDAPTLTAEDLRAALDHLRRGSDAVLAPASDGGYVLIGLRRVHPQLFADVAWGTSSVLEQTRDRFRRLGYEWEELRAHRDLDRPEDWARLNAENPDWRTVPGKVFPRPPDSRADA